jgi:hypothetical protein
VFLCPSYSFAATIKRVLEVIDHAY